MPLPHEHEDGDALEARLTEEQTLSEYARATREMITRAESVLLGRLSAQRIGMSRNFQLPDGSIASVLADGLVAFWGKS